MMGKEHVLLICNHRSDIDWLIGWVLAQRAGCLGSALAITKKEAKFLPIIGWSMWFAGFVFLDRSWAKDESRLKSDFQRLADFPMPFWMALFVEGTRFTQAKLVAAQNFAVSRGLPVPRNVLIPRAKGFVAAVTHMRSYVPAIYDCTVAVAKDQPQPRMLRILRGQSSLVKLQVKRHPMQELPETADGIAQWCKDAFTAKDALLEKYHTKGQFGSLAKQDIGRPVKSLIVVILWSCLLGYGIYEFISWSCLLSTWEGIVFVGVLILIIATVTRVLIHSSESERSMPVQALQKDPAKEKLLQK